MSVTGRKSVVLLSGGLDSATVLAMAEFDGFSLYAMSFSFSESAVSRTQQAIAKDITRSSLYDRIA